MTPAILSPAKRFDAALALLRGVTGTIFIAHGAQKLFEFGLAGVSAGFGQMGVPFPDVLGPFIAFLEFFGGIALIGGFLTRLVSLGLASTMVGAILFVHWKAGFFNPNGFEFPLALLGVTLALVLTGAGAYSLDAVIAQWRGARRPAVQLQRKAA